MKSLYFTIQQKNTGERIRNLMREHGYSVKDIQAAMGFENPQAVYKWLSGKSLPSLDNFLILSRILNTSIEDILVIDGGVVLYRDEEVLRAVIQLTAVISIFALSGDISLFQSLSHIHLDPFLIEYILIIKQIDIGIGAMIMKRAITSIHIQKIY